eukprot:751422-Hanusia_phi.AAC.1
MGQKLRCEEEREGRRRIGGGGEQEGGIAAHFARSSGKDKISSPKGDASSAVDPQLYGTGIVFHKDGQVRERGSKERSGEDRTGSGKLEGSWNEEGREEEGGRRRGGVD